METWKKIPMSDPEAGVLQIYTNQWNPNYTLKMALKIKGDMTPFRERERRVQETGENKCKEQPESHEKVDGVKWIIWRGQVVQKMRIRRYMCQKEG